MPLYAVQVLDRKRKRHEPKWLTLFVFKRLAPAERALISVRQNRLNIHEKSRVRPFVGPISRCYNLSEI